MARKLRVQFPGSVYHVTFRGNARQPIFKSTEDYARLIWRVSESAEDYGVRVYMYCWMPNHGHMLVETPSANLSEFMRSVLTGYTTYFNLKNGTCGHLMQGRFKSMLVDGDDYLMKLSRYIHLNPVKVTSNRNKTDAEKVKLLRNYPWSSYREYAGLCKPTDWLTTAPILAMFGEPRRSRLRYRNYVESTIGKPDSEFAEALSASVLALGSEAFIQKVEIEHARLATHVRSRDDVSLRAVKVLENPADVIGEVCRAIGISEEELHIRRRDATPKAIVALALIRRCGLTRRAVANLFGLGSGQAVGNLVRSLKTRAAEDAELTLKLEKVFKQIC